VRVEGRPEELTGARRACRYAVVLERKQPDGRDELDDIRSPVITSPEAGALEWLGESASGTRRSLGVAFLEA
jgi:hypothetical protein